MKRPEHDVRMTKVYAHIYEDFYGLKETALDHSRQIIAKNLAEAGIFAGDLGRMNVLNIGTGREVYVFHELGARNIYHFDVSEKSVEMLTRLKGSDPRFSNIVTEQRDVCGPEPLAIPEPVHYVYLNGVLHHFHDPEKGLQNIFRTLTASSKCFFRIYRSGSLAFFVVDYIRRFIRYEDHEVVTRRFKERFPVLTEETTALYDDLYDDFFVPVLNLFQASEMHAYFESNGFRVVSKEDVPLYHHGNTARSGQGVSLVYELARPQELNSKGRAFPRSVDQLDGINYREKEPAELVSLMKRSLPAIAEWELVKRIDLALELYEASQLYRLKAPVTPKEKWAEMRNLLTSKGLK